MKLCRTDLNLEFEIAENQILDICIENASYFSKFVGDLWYQCQGGEGGFILSEGIAEKNINKEMECIINPFSVDINDRKIINVLHKEAINILKDSFVDKTVEINSQIVNLLDMLGNSLPYPIRFNDEMDMVNLLKMYDFKLEDDAINMLDRIEQYIKVLSQICKKQYFVFVNLKMYLSAEEIEEFYQFCFLNKVFVIVVEGNENKHLMSENTYIIDKDMCIIKLD